MGRYCCEYRRARGIRAVSDERKGVLRKQADVPTILILNTNTVQRFGYDVEYRRWLVLTFEAIQVLLLVGCTSCLECWMIMVEGAENIQSVLLHQQLQWP